MKWRLGFLVCCAAVIAMAGAAVESRPETPWICCEGSSGCAATEVCCEFDTLGLPACDESAPGYCVEKCRRVMSGTFTPDPQ